MCSSLWPVWLDVVLKDGVNVLGWRSPSSRRKGKMQEPRKHLPKLYLLAWRLFVFLWLGGWTVVAIMDNPARWPFYLTHLSFTWTALYALLALYATLLVRQDAEFATLDASTPQRPQSPRSSSSSPPLHLMRAGCLSMGVAYPLQFIVTIVYWVLLFQYAGKSTYDIFENFVYHGSAPIVLYPDFLLAGWPMLWSHVLVTLIMAFLYVGWLWASSEILDENLYSIIDWKSARSAVYVVGIFLAFVLSHILFVAIMRALKGEGAQQRAATAAAAASNNGAVVIYSTGNASPVTVALPSSKAVGHSSTPNKTTSPSAGGGGFVLSQLPPQQPQTNRIVTVPPGGSIEFV